MSVPGSSDTPGKTAGRPPLPTESNLPPRIVVGANGAYWRDFGDFYSMCPVSTDNDPVEVVAVYERVTRLPGSLDERDTAGKAEPGGTVPVPSGTEQDSVKGRSPLRIRPFLNALEDLWTANPDLRFGQLVMNLTRDDTGAFTDAWGWENSQWLRRVEREWRRMEAPRTPDARSADSEEVVPSSGGPSVIRAALEWARLSGRAGNHPRQALAALDALIADRDTTSARAEQAEENFRAMCDLHDAQFRAKNEAEARLAANDYREDGSDDVVDVVPSGSGSGHRPYSRGARTSPVDPLAAAEGRADQAERALVQSEKGADAQDYFWRESLKHHAEKYLELLARAAELETALEAIARNAEAWHGPPEDSRHAAALAVIAKWARDPSTVPEEIRDHIAAARSALAREGDTGA